VAPCTGADGKSGVPPHLLLSNIGGRAAEVALLHPLLSSMKDGAAEGAVFTGNLK